MKYLILFFFGLSQFELQAAGNISNQSLEINQVDKAMNITEDKEERTIIHQSVNGLQEQCTILNKIPQGDYSKSDIEHENEYCSLSFNFDGLALCPKTWSTSPATMVYDLSKSSFSAETYEASSFCGAKNKAEGVSTIVKFKQTMNASGTSGTFSQSSLLYYHFSRYFDTKVNVPVAVYREMDKEIHKERVSKKGLTKAVGKMNQAGWQHLFNAESNPKTYKPMTDLFTQDLTKIYGVLIGEKGERYGSELNGTRASGWGKGQNRDFQKTPAFLALRDPSDLSTAIQKGLAQASQDSKMRSDLVGINDLQIVFWMRELIEITLLDFIFNQQDRVGNIDYSWTWYYIENGKVKNDKEKRKEYKDLPRKNIKNIPVPEKILAFNPVLIQRTHINDNDAGGKSTYVSFTESTDMLKNLKHYSLKTYKLLMALDNDFTDKGLLYQWLENSIDLDDKSRSRIIENAKKAAEILRQQCQDLKFDLDDVDQYLLNGARLETADCLAM